MLPTSGDQGGPVLLGTRKSAQLGKGLPGEGTLPVTHLDRGHSTPVEALGLLGSQTADTLGGSWAGTAFEEGTSKASLIPGDIFRHRSLLSYAVDQSPELYK